MKSLYIIISVAFVVGLTTYAAAADRFDPNIALQDCGAKVVQMGQDMDAMQAKADKDKKDAIAIGIAVGGFIGSGGLTALIPVVGGVLGLPFILLGF